LTPEMTLDLYGGEAFRRWLQRCFDALFGHGSNLVYDLGTKADNVYAACRCLEAAEALGWIKRVKFSPTREQRFFDVNETLKYSPQANPHAYGWEPVSASEGARAYLRSSP